jgi:hypothetical protein
MEPDGASQSNVRYTARQTLTVSRRANSLPAKESKSSVLSKHQIMHFRLDTWIQVCMRRPLFRKCLAYLGKIGTLRIVLTEVSSVRELGVAAEKVRLKWTIRRASKIYPGRGSALHDLCLCRQFPVHHKDSNQLHLAGCTRPSLVALDDTLFLRQHQVVVVVPFVLSCRSLRQNGTVTSTSLPRFFTR